MFFTGQEEDEKMFSSDKTSGVKKYNISLSDVVKSKFKVT